jgi:XRE family transcriptional regulator, aerobic/anaerobic benzoate catabolism transcriptional regulator
MRGAQDETYLRYVAERVREQRRARGMSRRELAETAGVSDRYVAQIESGRGNVSILVLRKLARALDVPMEHLLPQS